ncbi:TetR/AcrR family transcriptional regulator [Solicola gregarius]|uniref:TetR/AcrR family transcriptional regulator n=1 Tax=Solicola gregarius TaxID=2908642 RepID=A0AA46TJJ9_9ACTN|nr:TetR/AcrR family transcriptional regulator [Solicola gregarius]UYM06303.1 TetR/AcrR family transcriptional regulator [Solicola gregarius]
MRGGPRQGTEIRTPRKRRVDTDRREELLARVEEIVLAEGFTSVTVEELSQRLRCSKATLYSIASTKEQLVVSTVRHFFATAAATIEEAVSAEPDSRKRIKTYLDGVGSAMRRNSPAFYDDMVSYGPTAEIYRRNTASAATRVRELIDDGVGKGHFRATDGLLAAQVVALAIDGVQSGVVLEATGLSPGDAFAELGDLLLYGLTHASG